MCDDSHRKTSVITHLGRCSAEACDDGIAGTSLVTHLGECARQPETPRGAVAPRRRHRAGRRTPERAGPRHQRPPAARHGLRPPTAPPRPRAVVRPPRPPACGRPAAGRRGRGGGRGSAPAAPAPAALRGGSGGTTSASATESAPSAARPSASRSTARWRTRPAAASSCPMSCGRASRCWTTARATPAAARGHRSQAAASTMARATDVTGRPPPSRASSVGSRSVTWITTPGRGRGRLRRGVRRCTCWGGYPSRPCHSSAERPATQPTGACKAARHSSWSASRRPLSTVTTSGATSRHRPAAIWLAMACRVTPRARS